MHISISTNPGPLRKRAPDVPAGGHAASLPTPGLLIVIVIVIVIVIHVVIVIVLLILTVIVVVIAIVIVIVIGPLPAGLQGPGVPEQEARGGRRTNEVGNLKIEI